MCLYLPRIKGDGLTILLARRKIDQLLAWGEGIGDRADSLPNVAALLRSTAAIQPGLKVYEYFADTNPPRWYKGEVVQPRCQGQITVRYEDNQKIDQLEREVRQWIDVREFPEWKRLSTAAKAGINYLRNRLEGNLPPGQRNYDCSGMFEVLHVVQAFDPSWAAQKLDADHVDRLRVVKSLEPMVPELQKELHAYVGAAKSTVIDHTESSEDHTFTNQVLKFYKEHSRDAFPTWERAAKIVFSFTPNSAAAERVFSLLNTMFGDKQSQVLGDYLQAACMLRYNKRCIK